MTTLTNAQLSVQCSYIAKNAASWAADLLTLPERCHRTADPEAVARFTDEMRCRLGHIEEMAGIPTPEINKSSPVDNEESGEK